MMSADDSMTTSVGGPALACRRLEWGLDSRRRNDLGLIGAARGLRFRFGFSYIAAIPQADFSRLLLKVPLRWRGSLRLH